MAIGVVKARVVNIEIFRRPGIAANNAASIDLKVDTNGTWIELEVIDNQGVTTRYNPFLVSYVTMGTV